MPNVRASGTFSMKGIWLLPWQGATLAGSDQAHISGGSPRVVGEKQEAVFRVVGRAETITRSSGVVLLDEGELSGALIDSFGVSGDEWLRRLDRLVKQQENYTNIWLVTNRMLYEKVELGSLAATPRAGGVGWDVELPFREKRFP